VKELFEDLRLAVVKNSIAFTTGHARDTPIIYDALIVAEDHRGRQHLGIDWVSIVRAILVAPCVGRICAVSTIEQQLVRTIRPRAGRDWGTKLQELVLARALAKACSKETIWGAYLQVAYYGATGDYAKTRAAFYPDTASLSPDISAKIVACLKYPIQSARGSTTLMHQIRAKHVENLLRSGFCSWPKRLLDRHRRCVRVILQRLQLKDQVLDCS
jgi:membrane carboxypeptidase/penicillin-binding protein PbpC